MRGRVEIPERALPGRAAGDTGVGGNGHEPPARRQHGERGTDVAQVRVMAAALDPGADRERRVHQHDRRHEPGQVVGDGLGVASVDGNARKEPFEQAGPRRGEFVEVEPLAGGFAQRTVGHDGEDAGARRGLQHPVAGADHGGLERRIGQGQGRGKLLQADLFLGAARMGGFKRRQAFEHREHRGGALRAGTGFAPHGGPVTLDEQHHRGFGGVVGVLPEPRAIGIGAPERAGHGLAQHSGAEQTAVLQRGQERARGGQQAGGFCAVRRRLGNRRIRAWGHTL